MATVSNIDWPSEPGLPVEKQKAELLAIIERVAQLRLNAIIFQVRPACDAFYRSIHEPWSEFLTGRAGQAPEPAWDPLAFVIEESHQRGIELHAWFNPFRARHRLAKSPPPPAHVSRTHPDWTRSYGPELWLDPGEPSVQEYSIQVMLDVLRRYDVDGVHIDDYFYPYPLTHAGKDVDFPDEPSWNRYRQGGGRLGRSDWRRENVDRFVERLNREIHAAKPWVKFGISPFGIWRPGFPGEVRGLDAYDKLYADARKWMQLGWADYFAPQLYWKISAPEQSFPALLQWWLEQNAKGRHVWPGLSPAYAVEQGWGSGEIVQQVRIARQHSAGGHILFSMQSLRREKGSLGDALARQLFSEPALAPESPWLGARSMAKPQVSATSMGTFKVTFANTDTSVVRFWLVQTRTDGRWTSRILAGTRSSLELPGVDPDRVAVTAIGRTGHSSPVACLTRGP